MKKVLKTSTEIGIQYFQKEVRVYRNLTKKCFTIQHKTDKGWRVLDHCLAICLSQATFRVYKSGQDRVRKEGKKYVHAYVCGVIVEPTSIFFSVYNEEGREHHKVFYNPYLDNSFVYDNNVPVFGEHLVIIDPEGLRVSK